MPCFRRLFCLVLALLIFRTGVYSQSIPAFPGAEGFGAHSTGGRGGDVYIVTNLKADGEGSFLKGIQTAPAAGRTIVFAVSGFIPINKPKLKASKITIAGQTAPGDGVCLRKSSLFISGEDIIMRFIRIRHGKDGNGDDCINPDGQAKNLIIDHCDMMFSKDENFSMFRSAPPTLTYQWSVNAWGLQSHSAGGLWLVDHATVHHTLWAHNHTRNPKLIRPGLFDWTNNVTFGWDIGFNLSGAETAGTYKVNIRGSSFVPGGKAKEAIFGGGTAPDGNIPFSVHMNDCGFSKNKGNPLEATVKDYAIIASGSVYNKQTTPFPQTLDANPGNPRAAIIGVPLAVDDRITAFKKILSQVGATRMEVNPARPLRDEVTALLVDDVINQRRRIIQDPAELGLGDGGFGNLKSTPAPVDRDRDGMPDEWETALGSNPAVDDHNEALPASGGFINEPTYFPPRTPAGYTRLEEYLHFLAIPHGMVAASSAGKPSHLEIDLTKFTSGFTKSPAFKISAASGGTVTLGGSGGCMATFQPKPGHTGRAKFDFTVTDAEGSSWTQTCALLVTGR